MSLMVLHFLFFFNDTATTEIYTLSLHDALPISAPVVRRIDPLPQDPPSPIFTVPAGEIVLTALAPVVFAVAAGALTSRFARDRQSTRLNSSHSQNSYSLFFLTKTTKPERRRSHT